MANNYAQAIFELLQSGRSVDVVLLNVQKVMADRGHHELYGVVLKAVVSLLESQATKNNVHITLANVAGRESTNVKNALTELGATTAEMVTTIDPTLIGGVVVTYKNQHLDQSYKTALKNLYQSITTN